MSGGLYRVIDAAWPPSSAPAYPVAGVLGYIGGDQATHVWSPAEWQPFAGVRQFPAWICDTSRGPAAEAAAAAAAARALGWAAHLPDPGTRAIIGDMETAVAPGWWAAYAAQMTAEGFTAVCYGSLSTVLGNAASDNWIAAWDSVAALQAGQTIHGDQYAAGVSYDGAQVDLSIVDDWLFQRGGLGARHGT